MSTAETPIHSVLAVDSDPISATRPSPMRWGVAFVLFLAVISAFFDRISVAVLFTNVTFQNDMGIGFDPTRLGLLMTSFVFAYGVSGLLLSFIGDVYGPRRSLAVGAALWGGAMLLMGSAGSYTTMLFYRVLLGIAEGPQFALTNSLVKRWFPPREQARANSIWMIGSPLGSAVGFPLTIYLVSSYGWRSSFYVLAALNLLVILPLVLLVVRDRPPNAAVAAAAPAVTAASYGQQVRLFFGDWRFWMLVIFNSAALIYLWGLNSWLPSYLVKVRGFDMKQAGIYTSLPFIFMFLGEVLSAILSDRLGRRAGVCFVALLLAGISMYLVSVIPDNQTAALMIAVSAFCWGSALPPLFALGLQILPAGAVAAGVGVYNGIGNLIGAFAPLAMGLIISSTGNYSTGLLVIIGAATIGSAAMIPLMRKY
ncbi:MFS transporter [Tardiphaga sp.]|uniref:MFS transporter n=1 Tax=Tardiphaga sp. TaxID=1926292 RepID=UPI0025F88BBA|nr:MFS transporter [Tardiphaga sp.]